MKKLLRLFMLAALFLPLALNAQTSWTVADGTTTHAKVPLDFYNCDGSGNRQAQMLYPASLLTDMNGSTIGSITFYHQNTSANKTLSSSTWYIRMGETTATDLSEGLSTETLTTVYSGNLVVVNGVFSFEFTTPYTYNGGNLIVEIQTSGASGNYFGSSNQGCYGVDEIGSTYSSMSSPNYTAFLPKTTFTEVPSCFPVTNLTINATATTSSSLTFNWVDANNSGATYSVYAVTDTDTTLLEDNISGTTYTASDLTANTTYTYAVEANCSATDAAAKVFVSGRTACAAISELPYTMGFENEDLQGTTSALLFPYCWTRINTLASGTNTYYPYAYNYGTPLNGSRHLYFYASSYGTYADTTGFIMPELDINTYPMNANRVTFWAKVTSTTPYNVTVGTMSDPADMSTFTAVETVPVSETDYTKHSVSLADAPSTDAYVAFIVPKVASTMYIDDVTLEELPSCLEISNLAVSGTTSNSITLSWVDEANPDGTSYTIYNMPEEEEMTDVTFDGTTAIVSGLDANTQYTLGVQANCPSGNASIMTVSGRTSCAVEALPYSETFDVSLNSDPCWRGATALYSDDVEVTMGNIPTNWAYQSSVNNGIEAGHYRVNIYGTNCKYWLITPEIDLTDATNPLLTFDAAFTVYSSNSNDPATGFEDNASQAFKVLVTTDGGQTWSLASDISLTSIASSTYLPQYVNLSEYAGETVRVAFYAQSTVSGGDNNLHIDNILIEESIGEICYPVTGLTASNVTAHEATLTWSGDVESYTIYDLSDSSEVATVNNYDTTYSLTGLASASQHSFGVVANCTSGSSVMVSVTFTTLVSCVAPTNVAVALTPGDGSVATVNWIDTIGAAWQLCLNGDTTDLYDADETSYTFDELTPEQTYTVMVRTNCSSDDEGFSTWTSVVNFTPTDAYSITVNEGTTTNDYVPIYGLYVDDITKSQFIIPATDLTAMQFGNINKLTFYASTASAPWNGASFNVYLTETNETTVETLADYDGMTQVYAGSLSIVDNKMVVNFTTPYTYMGGNLMIGFLQTVSGSYASSYWYGVTATGASQGGYGTSVSQKNFLPKTTINYAPGEEPDCLPVNGLAASEITTEGATLTWNGDADSYNVYVINGTDTTFEQNVSETTATLTGLTAMTSYTYGVRAVCGTNESDIRTVSFATACAAVELPYTETFEETSGALSCWTTEGNGTWTYGTGDYSTSTGAFEGSRNAKITHSTTGDATKLISPVLDGVEEGLTLNFAYVLRSWAGDVDELRVYSRADAESAWQQVAEYTNAAATWTVENVVIPGTVYQIAFEYTDNYGYGLGIDSVVFTAMTSDFCFAPTGLTVSDITTEGATLTWNGDANSYNVYVINGTDTTLAEQNVSENTLALTGLTAMTSYTYGVRSVCPNDESEMVIVTFATACAAVELPYTETFETTSATRGCWELISNNAANIGGTYGMGFVTINNHNVLRFSSYSSASDYNQYGYSPLMEVSSDATNLMVNVVYATYGSTDELYFGYITDTDTIWDPTPYSTDNNSSASNWQTYTAVIPATATQLAIHYYGNYQYYAWIDSVSVTEMTGDYCYAVTNLTVDSTTTSSVFLSWTDNNNTDITYTVYNGDNVVATNIANTNYEVTGLSASNNYTFGVVANCSATDASDMVTINATTECGDVTALPYNEGFENDLGCWTTVNGSSDGQPWFAYNCAGLTNIGPHSGNYVASSWSWNADPMHANAWLISPKFVLPNTTEGLTFTWWEATSAGYPDSYSVVLSTTTNDTASFTTVVRPYGVAAGEWTQQAIDLSSYAGQSIYIAFHHVDYDMNYLLIDDIELSQGGYVPPTPDTLTVTFAVNDATMGTTNPVPGTYQYITGDTVFFAAIPNAGYHFIGWEFAIGSTVADTLSAQYIDAYVPANSMMEYGNMTLTALFEVGNPDSTTITYAVNDPTMGTITPAPGTYTIYVGDAIDATATPNTGYQLSAWMFDIYLGTTLVNSDTILSTDADFSNPMHFGTLPQTYADYNATITITALFEADSTPVVTTYTVTLSTADATMGTVNLPGENTVVANNQFTAQATANEGYHFVAWTSNNATISTANPYTFTVTADIALTATFEADSTPVVVCNTPTGLHYTAIENHAIAIAWDADANVNSWNIRYRMSGNGAWNNATSNTNSYTISGLQGLTSYDIEVQANCGDGNVSEWCDAITVQTTNVGIVNHLENSVVLFPNPAREYVDIRIDGEFNVSSMEVYDVYGKLINNINVVDNPTRIYVSNLSNGMYFVRVTTDKGTVTKTFVKK